MKIHYIANARFPSEKAHSLQIAKTCEAFADLGHEVTLVRPWRFNSMKGDLFDTFRMKRNFRVVSLFSIDTVGLGYFGFWLQLTTFSISTFFYGLFHRRDIIYSRDELPLYTASLGARKIYWESHTGRYNFLIASLIPRARGVVVITGGLRDLYVQNGVDPSRIIVAHDAVEPKDFVTTETRSEARSRLNLPQDKKIALYIGRLDGWKGVDTLLQASTTLPDDTVVAIIGGNPSEIASIGAEFPRVIFLGFRPYAELARNQAAADMLILPNTGKDVISVRYTSPLKLFTYMLSNRPIICSDLPSVREIVSESEVYFFQPDDPKSLATVITDVLSRSQEAAEKAARAYTLGEKYTWANRAQEIAKLFS